MEKIMNVYVKPLRPILGAVLLTAACVVVERMTFKSQTFYLPQLLAFLQVPNQLIGTYAGLLKSLTFLLKGCSILLIPYFVAKHGEHSVFCYCNLLFGIAVMLNSFIYNFPTLIIDRLLIALTSAYPLITQIFVFKICNGENETLALILTNRVPMLLASSIGPVFGGFLAFPTEGQRFALRGNAFEFFKRFPVFLPNMVLGCLAVSISVMMMKMKFNRLEKHQYKRIVASDNVSQTRVDAILEKTGAKSFWRLLKTSSYWTLSILFSLIHVADAGSELLLILWLETPSHLSGGGYQASEVGVINMLVFMLSMVLNVLIVPLVSVSLKEKNSIYLWSIVGMVLTPMLIWSNELISDRIYYGVTLVVLWACLITALTGAKTAAIIKIKQCTSNGDVPVSLVACHTLKRLFKAVAVIVMGSLYSWSLTNETGEFQEGMGYPFNHSFGFIVCSLIYLIVFILATKLPSES